MDFSIEPKAGWENCVRIANDTVEIFVTLDAGPRVLHYSLMNRPNVFRVFERVRGGGSEEQWNIMGGHRLWHAPEEIPRTYQPDNQAVEHDWDGSSLTVTAPTEIATGIEKQMSIRLAEHGSGVRLVHRLRNRGMWPVSLAAWTLNVMDYGARAIVPQEPFVAHADQVLPARPLVLWAFTDMADARWTWGSKFVQLRQNRIKQNPQKVGMYNSRGWAACMVNASLFVSKFPAGRVGCHTDMGCNTELFTNDEILEVETLGEYRTVQPGETIEHLEQWGLFDQQLAEEESDFERDLMHCVGKVANA